MGQSLCPSCWGKLQFVTKPQCRKCGLPFAFDLGDDALCASCLDHPPLFDRARSAMKYDDHSKGMILAFKHADKTHLRLVLAKFLWAAGREFWQDADLIAPVPLHWTRLFRRLYNQSALLGEELGKMADKPHLPRLLRRRKKTRAHQGLSKEQRRKNVRGAFELHPAYAGAVSGKNVVLVDDVHTSGATANECAKVLRDAGAARVDVLALARVCFD